MPAPIGRFTQVLAGPARARPYLQLRGSTFQPANPNYVLKQDDLLIVEGSLGDGFQAGSLNRLEPKGAVPLEEFNQLEENTLRLAELIVPNGRVRPWQKPAFASVMA